LEFWRGTSQGIAGDNARLRTKSLRFDLEGNYGMAGTGSGLSVCADFKWTNINAPKNPFDGGAEMLGRIAKKICAGDVPVFVCSRNEAGNRFVLDCVDGNAPPLKGWLCHENKTWTPPPRKTGKGGIPGIIAAATDSIWYGKARDYFNLGRKAEKNWTWLGYDPIDSAPTRDFACRYFAALLSGNSTHWRDIATKKEVVQDLFAGSPEAWS
jgi:hypothetical protein